MIVELVVEVVPCTLLGKSQVGGKVVNVFTHGLLLLMQSTLCTKEVTLGDEGGHVVILLHEEWVGRSTWPIHHEEVVVSRNNERTKPKLPFPKIVDVTSTISRCYNRGIGTDCAISLFHIGVIIDPPSTLVKVHLVYVLIFLSLIYFSWNDG